jgi:ADP-ribosylglycohydrolase
MLITPATRPLVGALIGDITGSAYEWNNVKTIHFDLFHPKCYFTDDSVLAMAVADALIQGRDFGEVMHAYGRAWPGRGYGENFELWLESDRPEPYGSYGNGSAMRVAAVAAACDSLDSVLETARASALPTHDHPEGIKGAQATAAAIFMARSGADKAGIRRYLSEQFGYDLDFTLDSIRPTYVYDVTCQGTVPPAVVAFLESQDFEHAIRLAISIGGDSDTLACITGSIAAAFYPDIPRAMTAFAERLLPEAFLLVLQHFDRFVGKG